MLGDGAAAMEERELLVALLHFNGLSDELERHGVAVGREADEIIAGDNATASSGVREWRLARERHQCRLLRVKSLEWAFVSRAVHAHVGNRGVPVGELLGEIHDIDEAPDRQEVVLHVLHARLDFAFGLRAIGTAQARLEAPILGEAAERCVPHNATIAVRRAHGASSIVEMLLSVAAEVLESARS